MGADIRDTHSNEFRVTAGDPGTPTHTLHVKVAVADDDMMRIAKCILLGGGTCPNT